MDLTLKTVYFSCLDICVCNEPKIETYGYNLSIIPVIGYPFSIFNKNINLVRSPYIYTWVSIIKKFHDVDIIAVKVFNYYYYYYTWSFDLK